jgi:recombination protein RecT
VVDDEPGDALDAENATTVKPEAMPQQVVKEQTEAAKTDQAATISEKLAVAIGAMEKATTNEALDEIYIRLEADFEGADLEALMREYRRIKANIGSLI